MHEFSTPARAIADQLAEQLAAIGDVAVAPRFNGYALLENEVMFAFVDEDGVAYLRAGVTSAQRFASLGGTKHVEMPYWSIPTRVLNDAELLLELAYQAADIAHLAADTGPIDVDTARATAYGTLRAVVSLTLLSA